MTDSLVEILRLERSVNAQMFISLGKGFWPSPWWLQYGHGFEREPVGPGLGKIDFSPRRRDWQTHQESGASYRQLIHSQFQVPVSCLAPGPLRSDRMGEIDDLENGWADAVAEYLGRGAGLVELAVDSDELPDKAWEVLGSGLRWKASRQAAFQRGMWVGQDPGSGESYGYLHWTRGRAVAVFQNPSSLPREINFQLPKGLGPSLRMFQTYPRLRQESAVLKGGDFINTQLEGLETRVLELVAMQGQGYPLPFDVDFALAGSHPEGDKLVELEIFPETLTFQFSNPSAIENLQIAGQSVSVESTGKVDLQDRPQALQVVEARKSLSEKKAEVGMYARRGVQLTLPQWEGVTSNLVALLSQPSTAKSSTPLFVTLNRKQLRWAAQRRLEGEASPTTLQYFSTPLDVRSQVLVDWALKDEADTLLYLWWVLQAPRPALKMSYSAKAGKLGEFLTTLLLSPSCREYWVGILLEGSHSSSSTSRVPGASLQ